MTTDETRDAVTTLPSPTHHQQALDQMDKLAALSERDPKVAAILAEVLERLEDRPSVVLHVLREQKRAESLPPPSGMQRVKRAIRERIVVTLISLLGVSGATAELATGRLFDACHAFVTVLVYGPE
jgi:hypothetical protein